MHFVYFAKSVTNGKVYVVKTEKDPKLRVKEHNMGSNQWTKRNGPFKLIYFEQYHCRKDASLREIFFKSGFGKQIKKLIIDTLAD